MTAQKRLGILVGGGPAPGINSVISAATIRGLLDGVEVLGVRDGFEWIMQGDIDHVVPLTTDAVSPWPVTSPKKMTWQPLGAVRKSK